MSNRFCHMVVGDCAATLAARIAREMEHLLPAPQIWVALADLELDRSHRMKLMGAIVVLAFASAGVSLAQPSTGSYGPLSLVVQDGAVHGVFSEGRLGNGTDEAPQFSCVFLLQGQLQDGVAKITSWFPSEPDRIEGSLKLGDNPTLQLQENHGGCLMSSGDMVQEPYPLLLDQVQ